MGWVHMLGKFLTFVPEIFDVFSSSNEKSKNYRIIYSLADWCKRSTVEIVSQKLSKLVLGGAP